MHACVSLICFCVQGVYEEQVGGTKRAVLRPDVVKRLLSLLGEIPPASFALWTTDARCGGGGSAASLLAPAVTRTRAIACAVTGSPSS